MGAVEASRSALWSGSDGPDLERILLPEKAAPQPPIVELTPAPLTAAIGSLALGGAERIVLDWAARCARRHRVRLIVLRDAREEWTPPAGIELVRLNGEDAPAKLESLGREAAQSGNPVVLCHLLLEPERRALERGGAQAFPVLHNARAGWPEPACALAGAPCVIAVSRAAAAELRAEGVDSPVTVLRHFPRAVPRSTDSRNAWRARWAIPRDALLIGMIGGVKPQKAYPRALRVLAALLARRTAYLVILGGPTGRDGTLAWNAIIAQARRLDIAPFVRLPGSIESAARCLAALDLLLNTSRYEGLSIATLEALAAGLPAVASRTGGQGEIESPGLKLLDFDAPDAEWASALESALGEHPEPPAWLGFPTDRAWTLSHLAPAFMPGAGVLFVTANLNAGGAQRSLINLARELAGRLEFEIAVCGDSSTDAFARELCDAGVAHYRTAATRDCFDHAEAVVRRVTRRRPGAVCFWNVDAKVKLLVSKALAHTRIRFFDVSPGAYAFSEMRATRAFQEWIGYSEREYYERLDRLVLKYHARLARGIEARTSVIANGVPLPVRERDWNAALPRRIVVSGRIAPSKFLLEIAAALRAVWERCPSAELHVLGPAEPQHAAYAAAFLREVQPDLGTRVFVAGCAFDAPERLADYDIALVLGEHQGCPNAVLEGMAAGLAVVANDSGGTRELIADGRSGLLLRDRQPDTVARALLRVLLDARLARRLARAARDRAARRHSMKKMADAYFELFSQP